MAGFDPNSRDEFSVSEILREVKDASNELNTVAEEFGIDEILAEFSSVVPAAPVEIVVEERPVSVPPKEVKKPKQAKPKKEKTSAPKKEKPKKQVKKDTTELYTLSDFFGEQEEKKKKEKPKKEKKAKKQAKKPDGPSVSPQEYVDIRKSAARLRGLSAMLLLLVSLALAYLCFAPALRIPIPQEITVYGRVELYHLFVLALSVLAMLIAFPILTDGIRQIAKKRLGVESALVVAQVANLLHIGVNLFMNPENFQEPYAPVIVFALYFATCGLWKRDRARIRACKTAGMSKEPLGIYTHDWYREVNIIKQTVHDETCFARRVEDEDGGARFWRIAAPIVLCAALIFATVSAIVHHDVYRFFWTFAAVSAAVVPFFALYAFAQPYSILTRYLSGLGSAITGWYAAESISGEQNLIIRDSDLFPKGAVSIHGIKMLGDFSLEQTLSYVTSIFQESNNGLFSVFYAELKSKFGRLVPVRNMRHYEAGVEAELEGNQVLVGTAAFLIRMGVRLGEEKDAKNVVFIAVNGSAAGVFHIKYKDSEEIRDVLLEAMDYKVKPVLAVVDFNLTPMMVEQVFGLPTDSLEYPNVEDRIDLATDSRFIDRDACAYVTRNGFVPFASCLLAAKRLRTITKRNLLLTALCIFFGMMLMFCFTWIGNVYASAPYHLFLYQLLWMLPMLLVSQRVK